MWEIVVVLIVIAAAAGLIYYQHKQSKVAPVAPVAAEPARVIPQDPLTESFSAARSIYRDPPRLPRELDHHEMMRGMPSNSVLVGLLMKQTDDHDPFPDNAPNLLPLFKIHSPKSRTRFFYHTIEQRYPSKLELKIPLDNAHINGKQFENSEYYGIPELYDGDTVENIPICPGVKFVVKLYKNY